MRRGMASGRGQQAGERRTPEDWIRAGLEELLEAVEAPRLKITRLARRLGVTPGSFYWHFRDRDQLRDRLLEYWMSQMLNRVAVDVRRDHRGAAALRKLPGVLVSRGLPDVDAAMRRWAKAEPTVAAAVARADELRARRASEMFRDAGFGEKAAALRGQMLMWIFVGSIGAEPKLRRRAFEELAEVLLLDR